MPRVIHCYKPGGDATKDAGQLCADLELTTGLKFHRDDPNDAAAVIHGYVDTDSQGHVYVHVYEAADLVRIAALPADKKGRADFRHGDLVPDAVLSAAVDSVLLPKGYQRMAS